MNQEFKNKNDYSVIVFENNRFLCKYTYVGNLYKFVLFLEKTYQFKNWTAMNVYVRRSGRFLKQYRNGDFIPPKPRF